MVYDDEQWSLVRCSPVLLFPCARNFTPMLPSAVQMVAVLLVRL